MKELGEKFFIAAGYTEPKQLADGTWVAFIPLLYTTGLCIGLDHWGWKKRYCFEDKKKALEEYNKLESINDIPEGWIAKRPETKMEYQPQWSMCSVCNKKLKDCSQLKFEYMQALGAYKIKGESVMIVKCEYFIRLSK